jgi:Xaa-Pro dipeptidase
MLIGIALQAKHQAYGIIAASGENASTLHFGANNEPLEGRQLVVLDAGCEWQEYASDVTRTFPISGTWTTEAKGIYDIVAKMQEECIAMVKPGVSLC